MHPCSTNAVSHMPLAIPLPFFYVPYLRAVILQRIRFPFVHTQFFHRSCTCCIVGRDHDPQFLCGGPSPPQRPLLLFFFAEIFRFRRSGGCFFFPPAQHVVFFPVTPVLPPRPDSFGSSLQPPRKDFTALLNFFADVRRYGKAHAWSCPCPKLRSVKHFLELLRSSFGIAFPVCRYSPFVGSFDWGSVVSYTPSAVLSDFSSSPPHKFVPPPPWSVKSFFSVLFLY